MKAKENGMEGSKEKKEEIERKRARYYRYRNTHSWVLLPALACSAVWMLLAGARPFPIGETALTPAPLPSWVSQEWALVTPVAVGSVFLVQRLVSSIPYQCN